LAYYLLPNVFWKQINALKENHSFVVPPEHQEHCSEAAVYCCEPEVCAMEEEEKGLVNLGNPA
jgi:hypothetical protein